MKEVDCCETRCHLLMMVLVIGVVRTEGDEL